MSWIYLFGFPEQETILNYQTLQTGHTKQNWEGGVVFELPQENSLEFFPVGTLGSTAPSPQGLVARGQPLYQHLAGLCRAGEEQRGQQK